VARVDLKSAGYMFDLPSILANRAWLRRPSPFPHVVACNVFAPLFYEALATSLRRILEAGLSESPIAGRFSRNIPGYDAYGIGINDSLDEPLTLFVSPVWRDLMVRLFAIPETPYVFAGAHHHAVGSLSGFVHNDFNPVWFPRANGSELQIPQQELCAYKTGAGPLSASEKVEVVRGAVVIFYLLNDGWRPGDGGETGLFDTRSARVSEPQARCGPENNSLVAFECTPESYHTFLTNHRLPRTSIIMWVHRPLDDAVAKFGDKYLERWKS